MTESSENDVRMAVVTSYFLLMDAYNKFSSYAQKNGIDQDTIIITFSVEAVKLIVKIFLYMGMNKDAAYSSIEEIVVGMMDSVFNIDNN